MSDAFSFQRVLLIQVLPFVLSVVFQILSLIAYRVSMADVPDSKIKSSYGLIVFCIFVELTFPIPLAIDKCKGYPVKIPDTLSDKEPKAAALQEKTQSGEGYKLFTVESAPSSVVTSRTSLSEVETYKKFVYDDFENGSASMGSTFSVHTQSTVQTNVSRVSTSSKESAV